MWGCKGEQEREGKGKKARARGRGQVHDSVAPVSNLSESRWEEQKLVKVWMNDTLRWGHEL